MKITSYLSETSEMLAYYWQEIKLVIYVIFGALSIDINIVKWLSVLMIVDTVLGSIKAVYVSKLKFTFRKLLWGIVSKATILAIPMILALVALALGFDFKWLVEIVLRILVISEAISSITNILSIKEKKNLENTDYISKLLHTLRSFFARYLDKLFEKMEK